MSHHTDPPMTAERAQRILNNSAGWEKYSLEEAALILRFVDVMVDIVPDEPKREASEAHLRLIRSDETSDDGPAEDGEECYHL